MSTSKEANNPWLIPAICIFLAVITLAVFGQTSRYGFVNYDDQYYVYENPDVSGGLTLHGIVSVFSHYQLYDWVPLTMISHMVDCQIFGLNAGGFHLTNVLLHTASVILLFLVLQQMTGAVWRSAFVAVIFAIHPLRVESVVWVSERKDVLSGFFFMLTLWAYLSHVRKPGSFLNYLLLIFSFAIGLMSKSILMTVPVVLLLLDYWPLNRFSTSPPSRLIVEKIPLLGLSAACGIIAIFANAHAVQPLTAHPLSVRLENAFVFYALYAWQLLHPANLAVFYPYPVNGHPFFEVFGAACLLAAVSFAAFFWRQKYPYLLVGWLWYLMMLAPVIGIVQVGLQSRADRYTYLPQIGLCLMLIWLAVELSSALRNRRLILGGLAFIFTLAMLFSARRQTSYWADSETLWKHTLASTSDNAFAWYCLGDALNEKGRVNEAVHDYQTSLALNPNFADTYNNLGDALAQIGQVDTAIADYHKALGLNPDDAQACNNLGNALAQEGQLDAAILEYQKALTLDPHYANPYCDLGNALAQKGQMEAAIVEYQKALALDPDNAQACNDLGIALAQIGQVDAAIVEYQKALALDPDNADLDCNLGIADYQKGRVDEAIIQFQKALTVQPRSTLAQNSLTRIAWVMATSPNPSLRNASRAIQLATQTDRLAGSGNPMMAATLAASDAEGGKFPEAITNVQRAIQLASSQNEAAMVVALQAQRQCYLASSPFRDAGTAP